MRRPKVLTYLLATTAVFGFVVACSSGSVKPDAGGDPDGAFDPNREGSAGETGTNTDGAITDGSTGDITYPKTCSNTIRDGMETDVDCGGTECQKCIDGKSCVANTDCKGKSCINKICATANCKNGVTDGDESDVDCGGTVCPRCTIGKRCKALDDCGSGNCDNATTACACPTSMVIVSKSTGGAYCVDQTEVTKGQYNRFLTANVPVGDQIGACGSPAAGMPPANANFVPRGAWPPATTPLSPVGGIAFSMGLPVHYVDWCDAYSYCKWANKQLCGKINGGTNPPASSSDASQSAWYNACSAQGQKGWPYSTIYDQSKCNGAGAGRPGTFLDGQREGYGFGGANQDDGVYDVVVSDANGTISGIPSWHSGCQGGSTNLYQMSGNVAEWEDSCDGAATTSNCNLRGGSYKAADDATTLRCDATRSEVRMPTTDAVLADVGFRCCLY